MGNIFACPRDRLPRNSPSTGYGQGRFKSGMSRQEVPSYLEHLTSLLFPPDKDPAADRLEKFGYMIHDGRVKTLDGEEGFTFVNQRHYEEFGEIMEEAIFFRLQKDYRMVIHTIPATRDTNQSAPSAGPPKRGKQPWVGKSFYFVSPRTESNSNKVLILINGAGAVKAGQWSRRLMINESLEAGTQFPYIQWAYDHNYRVIVMNTNCQSSDSSRESSSPEGHAECVWKNVLQLAEKSLNLRVAIVAHSYGASVTLHLARKCARSFQKLVFAVAFTDGAVFGMRSPDAAFLSSVTCNFVRASQPHGTVLDSHARTNRPTVVSAGTTVHEETSWKGFKDATDYINDLELSVWDNKTGGTPHGTPSGPTSGHGQMKPSDEGSVAYYPPADAGREILHDTAAARSPIDRHRNNGEEQEHTGRDKLKLSPYGDDSIPHVHAVKGESGDTGEGRHSASGQRRRSENPRDLHTNQKELYKKNKRSTIV